MTKTSKPTVSAEQMVDHQAVTIAMQQIEKEYGKGSIKKMGDQLKELGKSQLSLPGSFALNLALGVGGFPKGRIVEIYGPEASGKTTLCPTQLPKYKNRAEQLPLLTLSTHSTLFAPN